MAYGDYEYSNEDGKPVALYEFTIGTKAWRYTSDSEPVVANGETYQPVPISDNGTTQSGEAQNDDFVVTLPASTEIAQLFIGTPPSEEIWLTVRRK